MVFQFQVFNDLGMKQTINIGQAGNLIAFPWRFGNGASTDNVSFFKNCNLPALSGEIGCSYEAIVTGPYYYGIIFPLFFFHANFYCLSDLQPVERAFGLA